MLGFKWSKKIKFRIWLRNRKFKILIIRLKIRIKLISIRQLNIEIRFIWCLKLKLTNERINLKFNIIKLKKKRKNR